MPQFTCIYCEKRFNANFTLRRHVRQLHPDAEQPEVRQGRKPKRHFDDAQFENHRADGLRKLRPYAVPLLFEMPQQSAVRTSKKMRSKRKKDSHQVKLPTSVDISVPVSDMLLPLPADDFLQTLDATTHQSQSSDVVQELVKIQQKTTNSLPETRHLCKLANMLYKFQQTGHLCDTIVVAEDGYLSAHSAVLAAASPVLKASLMPSDSPLQHVIVFPGVELFLVKCILAFIYTGGIMVHSSKANCIIDALTMLEFEASLSTGASSSQKGDESVVDDCCRAIDTTSIQDRNVAAEQDGPESSSETPSNSESFPTASTSSRRKRTKGGRPQSNKYVCEVCGKICIHHSKWTAHRATHVMNESEKEFACNTCGKRFALLVWLKTHLKNHTVERPFICDACGKSFKLVRGWNEHRMHVHDLENVTRIKPLNQCSFCTRRFLNPCHMRKHILVHTGEKPFASNACLSRFRRRDVVRRHVCRPVNILQTGGGDA